MDNLNGNIYIDSASNLNYTNSDNFVIANPMGDSIENNAFFGIAKDNLFMSGSPFEPTSLLASSSNSSQATTTSDTDQLKVDSILDGTKNVLTSNALFEKLKVFEHRFGDDSETFIKKWDNGEVIPTHEKYLWANTYKALFD